QCRRYGGKWLDQAFRVNHEGARVVAELAASSKIPVIQLSTDYVFGGQRGGPYIETDDVAPLGIYGRSKEAGEPGIRRLTIKTHHTAHSLALQPIRHQFCSYNAPSGL